MHENFSINGISPHKWVIKNPNSPVSRLLKNWMTSDKICFKTSGSTGKPKSIEVSKEVIVHSSKTTTRVLGLTPGNRACLSLPLEFVAGKMMLFRSLVCGFDLITTSGKVEELFQIETNIDFMALTPYQVVRILNTRPNYFTQIKKLIIGGGPVYPELEKKLESFNTQIWETYGMTETVSHVALRNLNPSLENQFNALEGVKFSTDSRNCLVIHAPNWGHKSLITNDVVELISHCSFIWKGRHDFVINSGGIKIHPETIERILKEQLNHNFFVAGFPDKELGQKAVLIVESEWELPIDVSQIKRYQRPRKTIYLPKFFYTSSGKIDRLKTLSLI